MKWIHIIDINYDKLQTISACPLTKHNMWQNPIIYQPQKKKKQYVRIEIEFSIIYSSEGDMIFVDYIKL